MYLICRTQKLPYMLIDFSDTLQVRPPLEEPFNGY